MGTAWRYRVIAEGSFGESAPSPQDTVTMADVLLSPPADLVATPLGLDSVRVDFQEPLDAPGSVEYSIERAPDVAGSPGAFAVVATGITALPHDITTGHTPNTRYHYRAKPTAAGLADGPYSRVRDAMTLVSQPQSVTAEQDFTGCNEVPKAYRVDLAWSNANANGDQRTDVGTEWEYRTELGAWQSAGTLPAGATSGTITVVDQTADVRGRYIGAGSGDWVQRTVLVECPL